MVSCGLTRSRLDLLGFIRTHLLSLGFNWSHLASLGFTWTHLVSLGLTWSDLVSLGFTWIDLDSKASQGEKGGIPEHKREKGNRPAGVLSPFRLYIQSARTHARTETEIDFPVGLTPQPPIFIPSFVKDNECMERSIAGKHLENYLI